MSILPKLSSADDLWPSADPCCGLRDRLRDLGSRSIAWSRAVLADIVLWRLERRAACELRELDDRMLKDIGIAREEIEHAVRRGRIIVRASNPACRRNRRC